MDILLPGERVSGITEFVENGIELDSQSMRFILYFLNIIVKVSHCIFDGVEALRYFASGEVLCLTSFDT